MKVKYESVSFFKTIVKNNIKVKRCNCYFQECKGKFIPSRPDQKVCLWEIFRLERQLNGEHIVNTIRVTRRILIR